VDAKSGERLSLVEAVIGPNASGKTNLLNALVSVQWLISDSMYERNRLSSIFSGFAGNKKKDKPVTVSVTFEIKGSVYKYIVSIAEDRIASESLTVIDKSTVRTTKKALFDREWQDGKYLIKSRSDFFNNSFDQMSNKDLKKLSLITIASFRGDKNSLELTEYWKKLKTNIEFGFSFTPPGYDAVMAIRKMTNNIKSLKPFDNFDISIGGYDAKKGTFKHKYGDSYFELDVGQESSGTQRYIVTIEKLASVLREGGIAVIDEFDAYLHPLMFDKLVTQFFDKKKNKNGAQLLLSTHSLELLTKLEKYQVVLVDKINSSSVITRLDELDAGRVRSDENYYSRYMHGGYGALPPINQ
jgi:AAA15 family ATPase/GTPase